MTASSNATAGRTTGDLEAPNAAEASLNHDADRGGVPVFGQGQSDAEAQLYSYLERTKAAPRRGFQPMEELAARLGELSFAALHESTAEIPHRYRDFTTGSPPLDSRHPDPQIEWFERQFGELKALVTARSAQSPRQDGVSAALLQLIGKIDRLQASVAREKTVTAVEKGVAGLSQSMHRLEVRDGLNADRISRAAAELFVSAQKMEKAKTGFETAALATMTTIDTTIAASARDAATATARQVARAIAKAPPRENSTRMEDELRALNTVTRSASERTAQALDRVHETLCTFLDRNAAVTPSPPGKSPVRPPALHIPISADAEVFRRAPPTEPEGSLAPAYVIATNPVPGRQTGTSTPSGTREDNRIRKDRRAEAASETQRSAQRMKRRQYGSADDDRSFPIRGIAAVAGVLLVASAALFYLHLHSKSDGTGIPAAVHRQSRVQSPPAVQSSTAGRPYPVPAVELLRKGLDGSSLLAGVTKDGREAAVEDRPDGLGVTMSLTVAASQGEKDAQFAIGSRVLNSAIAEVDYVKAARWLSRAASQGQHDAQFLMGTLAERGIGITRDENAALLWYKKAAESGDARAMHNLAVLLIARGRIEDRPVAVEWFSKAANLGLTDAQYNLGVVLEPARGWAGSPEDAYFWYRAAAMSGDKEAKEQAERLSRTLPQTIADTVPERAATWYASRSWKPVSGDGG